MAIATVNFAAFNLYVREVVVGMSEINEIVEGEIRRSHDKSHHSGAPKASIEDLQRALNGATALDISKLAAEAGRLAKVWPQGASAISAQIQALQGKAKFQSLSTSLHVDKSQVEAIKLISGVPEPREATQVIEKMRLPDPRRPNRRGRRP